MRFFWRSPPTIIAFRLISEHTLTGLGLFVGSLTQGGTRSRGFALSYRLAGFQPFGSEPSRVGCGAGLTACRGPFDGGMEENDGVREDASTLSTLRSATEEGRSRATAEDAHPPGLGNLRLTDCGTGNLATDDTD